MSKKMIVWEVLACLFLCCAAASNAMTAGRSLTKLETNKLRTLKKI
jgi:hypothetical protein